jgi:predicted acetyltransferase
MILRPPGPDDEREFRAAQAIIAREGFDFGITLGELSWAEFLRDCADYEVGRNLGPSKVPASFRVADVDGVIVGRTSVRHRLNAALEVYGGHIGYAVLPAYRGRGYAKEILRQSLALAKSVGVERALLTCDETNMASRRVIESAGGVFDGSDGATRRYWVEVA